jgi:ATP-dependent 26S proteasome regulatory subunit
VDVSDTIEQITEILKIHLRQRGHEKDGLDFESLASLCAGFTGAEIEAWVAEALVHAFQAKRKLSHEDFITTVKDITSITTLMKADIKTAREWAKAHGVKYASIRKIEDEKSPGQRKISM